MPNSKIIVHRVYFTQTELLTRYEKLFSICKYAFIQQGTDWAEVIKTLGPDIPIFLLCEYDGIDVAGMPLYLFDGEYGAILTSIPQPGPVGGIFHLDNLQNDLREIIYENILNVAIKIAEAHNCLLFSTNTNPLFDDSKFYQKILSPNYVLNNFTQFINFETGQKRSHGVRNNINKSKNNKLLFINDSKQVYFEQWYEIHNKRHIELGITPLKKKLFEKLYLFLSKNNNISLVYVVLEDKLISGCIVVFHKKIMDLYMLSFDSFYSELKPNYFCLNSLLEQAKNSGIKYFNWQSSDSKYSGVYNFKKEWGSMDSDYQIHTRMFCSITDLKKIGLKNLKMAYPNHYLLPHGVFETNNEEKIFYKGEYR